MHIINIGNCRPSVKRKFSKPEITCQMRCLYLSLWLVGMKNFWRINDERKMIKLPPGIKVDEIPLDVMYRGVLRGLQTRIKRLYDAVYERFGEDGLKLIEEVSSGYGNDIARKALRGGGHWDIQRVGLYLIKIFNNMRSDGEVTEFTDKRVAIMVPRCPYPFEDVKICAAHTSMERALVRGLNPALDYRIEKSVPGGDPYCLHVLISNESSANDSVPTIQE